MTVADCDATATAAAATTGRTCRVCCCMAWREKQQQAAGVDADRSFEETNDGDEHSGVDAAADWPVLELVTMVLVLLLDLMWLPVALVNVLISSSLVVLFFVVDSSSYRSLHHCE